MDSGVTIDVSLDRHRFVLPQTFALPPGGLGIRPKDPPLEKERRLRQYKLPAALAWAKANGIDRTIISAPRPRLGIVCQGQAYKDVIEAFSAMGISLEEAASLGVCLYKVGMPWPLEPTGLRSFAAGLQTLMVIEHKRGLIEPHVFVNLGDGTYNHSGSLAIRGAIATGATLTYKLLFNDAVAMTQERKAERALVRAYEADVERLLSGLDADHLVMAVALARLPEAIGGFGHIKAAAMTKVAAQRQALWQGWATSEV